MTELLEKAFAEASKLSEADQNKLAHWILEELATEARWESILGNSQDVLAKLADEALEEHERGETELLDPENL